VSVEASESTTFSVEGWQKHTQSGGNGFMAAEGSTNSNTPYAGVWTDTSNKAAFTVRDNSNVSVTVAGTTSVNDGNWHHIVGVRDGNKFSIYVDGVLEGSTTTSVGTLTLNTTVVGALKRSSMGSFFTGWLDEVAYYPTALSAENVRRHYFR